MTVTIDGTNGITSPGGDVASASLQTPVLQSASTLTFKTNGTTTAMTVDASQNVGIGTNTVSNPNGFSKAVNIIGGGAGTGGGALYVGNTTNLGIVGYYNSDMSINNIAAGNVVFYTNANNERMRIDSSGNLLVGTASNPTTSTTAQAFRIGPVTTGVQMILSGTETTGYTKVSFNNGNGQVGYISTSGSATTYSTSSDYRLKENIAPMTGALDTIEKLKPVTYNWKVDGSEGQGFIAHELQEVVPDCVTGEKDAVDADGNPVYQGIDTSFLVATLTKAIQELNAKVKALEAKLA